MRKIIKARTVPCNTQSMERNRSTTLVNNSIENNNSSTSKANPNNCFCTEHSTTKSYGSPLKTSTSSNPNTSKPINTRP